jgi:hypothetical protein
MTGPLAQAQLIPIDATATGAPLNDASIKPVTVQFNPASFRLQLTNHNEGGSTLPRQAEQNLGRGSTTLTFDLHFDTADTGKDVRRLTVEVEKFLCPIPQGKGSKDAPPRVRFLWGTFRLDGLMESISEDIDLFSPAGVPLHAKLSISIKGQHPEFMKLETPPGSKTATGATAPGAASAPPGSPGLSLSLSDSTGVAIGGESAAAFAARMGLDPSVWRGLSAGLDSSLSLPAGLQIDFSSSLSASAGVGTTAGVESGASVSVDARFGLTPGPSAGFALAAAGGVRAAVDAVASAKATSAATDARAAFDVPAPAASGQASPPATADAAVPGPPEQPRPRLADSGLPGPGSAAPPAPQPPAADPRATTFGQGAPLRPRIAGATLERSGGAVASRIVVQTRESVPDVPATTLDPTTAPWLVLPSETPSRTATTKSHPAACGCGCGGST